MKEPVTKCLCHGTTFVALKAIAEKHGAKTLSQLQEHALVGFRCSFCHPYVKQMLKTGVTTFPVIAKKKPAKQK